MKLALVMASASFLPHEKISIRKKVLDDQKFERYLKSDVKLNGSRYRSRFRFYDLFQKFMKEHNRIFVSMLNTRYYVTCEFAIIQPKKHLNGC